MRPLRPLLGLPALRVRPFGSARRLYRGVDRGHPDHSGRGSTQSPRHPGGSDRSGTEMLARVRAASTRNCWRSNGSIPAAAPFRRNLFRLPGRHLHPAQGPVPPPGPVRPSLEAFGFDIGAISSELLHNELKWSRDGQFPEYFTLVSALFCAESGDTGTFTLTAQNPIP